MSEITNAIKQICEEKNLGYEAVITTIEAALAAAYRKDYGEKNQNIKVEYNPEINESKVFDVKTVVEDMPEEIAESAADEISEESVQEQYPKIKETTEGAEGEIENGEEEERRFNPKTEIQISEAKLLKKSVKIGEEIKIKLTPPESYGRMAAQTAKQVIIQKLREAEREMIFSDFKDKLNEVVSGVVQRREGRIVLIDLGRTVGILPIEEQINGEKYLPGGRIKIYVKEVNLTSKGPEIVLSRTSDAILKKVFYLEIPEISNGLIEIKSAAREAGSRSKVAVWTDSENVDPIGSCVGQRGSRIQTIISELGGEKVDIIQYDEDPKRYIANALSPAKILNIETNEEGRRAVVRVIPDQLSLAIGKGGQNARLAAKLTGWKIDIKEASEDKKEEKKEKPVEDKVPTEDGADEKKPKKEKKEDKKSESQEEAKAEKKKDPKKQAPKKEKTAKKEKK